MPCTDIQQDLYEYLEDLLPAGRRAEVDEHLSICERCRGELESCRATLELEHSIPEFEPPPYLASRIMAHVRAEADRPKGLARWLSLLPGKPVTAALAATLAIVVVSATTFRLFRPVEQAGYDNGLDTLPPLLISTTLGSSYDRGFYRSGAAGTEQSSTTGPESLVGADRRALSYLLGEAQTEGLALLIAGKRQAALERIEAVGKFAAALQRGGAFRDLTSSFKGEPDEILVERLKKIEGHFREGKIFENQLYRDMYGLGSLLVRVRLFAEARKKELVAGELTQLSVMTRRLKKDDLPPKLIEKLVLINEKAATPSPEEADFDTLLDAIEDLWIMVIHL